MKKSLGRRLVRRRPSPSMVVACLALAVALSGAGYAAIVLPANSVGTLQLKRNAVKSSKVALNTLKGIDIKESTLGRVPSAANATNADKLDGLDANQLTRATSVSSSESIDNFDTCAFTPVLTKPITAPASGILLVWGNIWAERDLDIANPAVLGVRAVVDATPVVDYFGFGQGQIPLGASGPGLSDIDGMAAVNGAVPVAAGARNVSLEISECTSGQAFILSRTLTTLFVPFGNAGSAGVLKPTGRNDLASPQVRP